MVTVLTHWEWGEPLKQEVQWIQKFSTPRYLPWWGSFTLSDEALSIMLNSLLEGPRYELGLLQRSLVVGDPF